MQRAQLLIRNVNRITGSTTIVSNHRVLFLQNQTRSFSLSRLFAEAPKGSKKLFPQGVPSWLRGSVHDNDGKKSSSGNNDKNENGKQSKDDKDDKKNNENKDKNENDKKSNNDKGNNDGNEALTRQTIWAMVGAGLFVYLIYNTLTGPNASLTWAELKKHVVNKNVKSVMLYESYADVQLNSGEVARIFIPNTRNFSEKLEGLQRDLDIDVIDHIPIKVYDSSPFAQALSVLAGPLITIAIFLAFISLTRRAAGGGDSSSIFKVGESKHKLASLSNLKTRFKDVAGMDEAKEEVMEFVSFLKHPKKYELLGAKIPKGALLVGPPGTGKTLLAKAIAGESGVPFFSISGSDFVEMFVGVGPSRVRDLFQKARAAAPCIIWIDEIDAVGRSRSSSGVGNDERENTLNQILVEMDGFSSQTNVIVLAGTNRVDILDRALTRPGRFDRVISVDAPDVVGRKQIFDVHLKKLKLAPDNSEFSKRLAALTPSMTGADIANICNEGALIAARAEKEYVEFIDFEHAIERVIAGLEKRSLVLSRDERTRVAYHEAGHAIAGWFLKHAYPLLKVSIVPRGIGALGYAQVQPNDQSLYSIEQLNDQVCTLLAGRAAEEIKFNNISTGARDDLEKVTSIVYGQLIKYGMNAKVGNLAFPDESGHMDKFYSEKTAVMIDSEARALVSAAYQRTVALLREKYDLVEKVAQHLLKNEILRRDEMRELVGPRPFAEITTYEQMLGEGHPELEKQ